MNLKNKNQCIASISYICLFIIATFLNDIQFTHETSVIFRDNLTNISITSQQNVISGEYTTSDYEIISGYGWIAAEEVKECSYIKSLRVAVDTNFNVHIFWSERLGTTWYIFHKVKHSNGIWDSEENIGLTTNQYTDVLDVKASNDGRIHLVWVENNVIRYRYLNSNIWSTIINVGYGYSPVLQINNENSPIILYQRNVDYYIKYFYASMVTESTFYSIAMTRLSFSPSNAMNNNFLLANEHGQEQAYFVRTWIQLHRISGQVKYTFESSLFWKENQSVDFTSEGYYYSSQIPNTFYQIAKPILLSSNDGNIHLIFQKPIDASTFELVYTKRDSSYTWSTPITLSNNLKLNCYIGGTIDEFGKITLVWNHNQYSTTTTSQILVTSYSSNTGQWLEERNLTNGQTFSQVPNLTLDADKNIHLVWADIIGNSRIIYYRKGWGDSDDDTLLNIEEINIYGTDPFNPDTDGDQLNDGLEISLGLDPLNPDSDNDTMTDGYEYYNGLDPFVDDSMGDFDGDMLLNVEEFQHDTRADLTDTDGDMVSDYDEVKVYFTNPLAADTDGDGLNDGLEIYELCSNPKSIDTDNDTMTDWYEYIYRDVLDILTNDSTLDPDGDGLINLLEFQWNTSPKNIDTDNDGLTDYEEVMIWGTHPVDKDTDKDGLEDGQEVKGMYYPDNPGANATGYVHTDPLKMDSDDDLLNDIIELQNNLNPNNNDTDGDSMLDSYEYYYGLDPLDPSDKWLDYDNDGLPNYNESLLWTDPYKKDTDGDKLSDLDELFYGTSPILYDTDGDGLDDYSEIIVLGTNATNPDTDGDGLNDYLEVHVYRSNPHVQDTDGDGLLDGDEVYIYNTNPIKRDTDGDGLDDNVEIEFNSDPTKIDTDGDGMDDYFEWLYGLDPRVDDSTNDEDSDGITNGEEYINKSNPLEIDTDLDGLTDYEEIAIYFTLPHVQDTDGDGLSDYIEIKVLFTNPHDPDTDDDGLSDGEEFLLGTNPLVRDTDGDGVNDGQEIEDGTDPLNPKSNKFASRTRLIAISFSCIIGFISFYYFVPIISTKFHPDEEVNWIHEGVIQRKNKGRKLIFRNKEEKS